MQRSTTHRISMNNTVFLNLYYMEPPHPPGHEPLTTEGSLTPSMIGPTRTSSGRRRRRTARACAACRDAHLACCHALPCSNCIERGIQHACQLAPSKPRGPRRKYAPRGPQQEYDLDPEFKPNRVRSASHATHYADMLQAADPASSSNEEEEQEEVSTSSDPSFSAAAQHDDDHESGEATSTFDVYGWPDAFPYALENNTEELIASWQPIADYLSRRTPQHTIK